MQLILCNPTFKRSLILFKSELLIETNCLCIFKWIWNILADFFFLGSFPFKGFLEIQQHLETSIKKVFCCNENSRQKSKLLLWVCWRFGYGQGDFESGRLPCLWTFYWDLPCSMGVCHVQKSKALWVCQTWIQHIDQKLIWFLINRAQIQQLFPWRMHQIWYNCLIMLIWTLTQVWLT